jgi:3-hydroxyisobutyrate dehydrogenase-like beta-hydroxyacid dehydrogenase
MALETIAFIGLGNMGTPMAGHLLREGYRLGVYARRPEAADSLVSLGVATYSSPADAAREAAFVVTNVTNTSDVEEVLLGTNGIIQSARPGTLCIDHSTISAIATRRIAKVLLEKGIEFIDAPVSGGVNRAREASLTIMVGGGDESVKKGWPLLERLGTTITHVGPVGDGQVAKACNQIAQVVNIQGIAEAMHFARMNGADPEKILAAISSGFAGSRMLDLMGPKMAKRDFSAGIEARLHEKDLAMIRTIADDAGFDLPAASLVAKQLRALVELGWGYNDTSSLLRVLEAHQAEGKAIT